MEVRSFWRPTTAALAALQAAGVSLERRSAPNAETLWGATLPEGFEIVRRGSPACATIIGVAGERAAWLAEAVIGTAERLAAERLAVRPGCGSPDGRNAHDDGIAIEALLHVGESRVQYKGVSMPWHTHPLFAAARAAAFQVAIGR